MVEPTPAVKWTIGEAVAGVQTFTAQIADQIKQGWTGRWIALIHIAQIKNGNPSASGHTIAFTKGYVYHTMTANAVYLVLSDVDGVVELTVTTVVATARRHVYAEVLGKPVDSGNTTAIPFLLDAIYNQNVPINFGTLPVAPLWNGSYNFGGSVMGSDATLIASIQSLIPSTTSGGYASLDLEAFLRSTPGGYAGAGWVADLAKIQARLDAARATRPNINWGFYQQPNYPVAFCNDNPGSEAARIARHDAYLAVGGLVEGVNHAQSIQPELYPYLRNATQEQLDRFASLNLDLCREVDAAATPSGGRPVIAFLWANDIVSNEFLGEQELSRYFIAIRRAGYDGAFLGVGGGYSPIRVQQWVGTTLTQALEIAGYL